MDNKKHTQFYRAYARECLEFLGNGNPTLIQLHAMQMLLSQVYVQREIYIDTRLNYREAQCLHLSAFGKSIKQIADFLDISTRQVERHRNAIFQKLNCKNIAQSVAQGIRFGDLQLAKEEALKRYY